MQNRVYESFISIVHTVAQCLLLCISGMSRVIFVVLEGIEYTYTTKGVIWLKCHGWVAVHICNLFIHFTFNIFALEHYCGKKLRCVETCLLQVALHLVLP
jgi:hypothetical protein